MMTKGLIALVPLLAMAASQAANLTNFADLDENRPGFFTLRWEVLEGPGSIVMEAAAQCSGWVSLLIVSPDGTYADMFFGGHDDQLDDYYGGDYHAALVGSGHAAPELDISNDVAIQGSVFHDPLTIIRWKRQLNTGDRDDVAITVFNSLLFVLSL